MLLSLQVLAATGLLHVPVDLQIIHIWNQSMYGLLCRPFALSIAFQCLSVL